MGIKPRCGFQDNIEVDLESMVCKCRMVSCCSACNPIAGLRNKVAESDRIKARNYLIKYLTMHWMNEEYVTCSYI
jgi:hypothetical protein